MKYILVGISLFLLGGCYKSPQTVLLTKSEFKQLTYEWSVYRALAIKATARYNKKSEKDTALFLRKRIDLDALNIEVFGCYSKFMYLYTRYLHDLQLGIRSIDPSYNE
jgi:hypothetical protein